MEKDIEKKIGAYLTILNEENILYKKENAIKGILEITTNLINRVKELEEENKKYENYTRLRSVVDFYNKKEEK